MREQTIDIKIKEKHHSKNTIHFMYDFNDHTLVLWCKNKYGEKFTICKNNVVYNHDLIMICSYMVLSHKEQARIRRLEERLNPLVSNIMRINVIVNDTIGKGSRAKLRKWINANIGVSKQLIRHIDHGYNYIGRINKELEVYLKEQKNE